MIKSDYCILPIQKRRYSVVWIPPYQLFVIKSGKGKQETEVSISVDETVLQSYNTDNGTSIQLLPSDCYTILQPALRLNDSDYRKAFDIKWNADRLSDLLSTGKEYGLPIQMSVVQNFISADDERLKTIIVPTIKEPYLQMDVPGMSPVLILCRLRRFE